MATGEQQIKEDLALAYRILADEGHGDTIVGILAARIPGGETFWIKSMALGMDEVTPESLLRLDLDGNVVEGNLPVHSEWPLFAEIFRHRPDVGSIVHTHAPYCCMLAAANRPIEPYDQFGTYHRHLAWFTETPNRINTQPLARAVARTLGQADAMFLKHHGIVTVAANIRVATLAATFLEKAAKRQVLNALVPGAQPMDPETARGLRESTPFDRMLPSMWAYYERRLGRAVVRVD